MASHSTRSPDLQDLSPKNKFDVRAIEILSDMNPQDWKPIAYDVLSWCADPNWPIARHVLMLFNKYPQNALRPVGIILRGDDREWQVVVFEHLVSGKAKKWQVRWLDDLKMFHQNWTEQDENDWELEEEIEKLIHDLDLYKASTLRGNDTAVA